MSKQQQIEELRIFPPLGFFPKTGLPNNPVLQPALFDKDGRMLDAARQKLMDIAEAFIKTLKLDRMELQRRPKMLDIQISGSNANFSYGKDSDIDLHILFDVKMKLLKEYFNGKKNQWNDRHKIFIKGIPVEVYVETLDTTPSSGGIYSVKQNKWINAPVRFETKARDRQAAKLANQWAREIDDAIATGDKEIMKKVLFKIRDARGRVLDQAQAQGIVGKSFPEDLAFKLLRRRGYIAKIDKAMDDATDRELSLLEGGRFGIPGVIDYHKTLNRAIWTEATAEAGAKLKPEVRAKSIEIAKEFAHFVGLHWSRVTDVRVKGSIANYNYTKHSDYDLHLIADVSATEEEMMTNKRIIWKAKFPGITIYGYPVELMIEKPGKIHTSSAVYSVTNDQWIDAPVWTADANKDWLKASMLYLRWRSMLKRAFRKYEKNPTNKNLAALRDIERMIRAERDKTLKGSKDPGERRVMELNWVNNAFKAIRDTGVFEAIKDAYEENKVKKLSLAPISPTLMGRIRAALSRLKEVLPGAGPAQAVPA